MKSRTTKTAGASGKSGPDALPPALLPTGPTVRVLPEAAGPFELIARSRSGVGHAEVRELAALLDLTIREFAVLLAMNERTMARRLVSGSLNKVESERLLLLKALASHGLRVFEDQGKFNRWLRRPLEILDGQSPLQLLDTATGFQVVDQILGRIEYGVYS
ncbi:type II RES/Xre toxin-antitoxin system antitoxin [Larkinella soli]|uniref:type II RES/Xre toxin-antitoxin system antitoxin n=1 Tax=Larkinella soli TaxID=1770527 RepID=UPI000FFB24BD|nr:antitoxin Xre/MbcA/ParS toxin-binding domain-containing protein [Larkinella soli]